MNDFPAQDMAKQVKEFRSVSIGARELTWGLCP
jgi:hypothetical protein